MALRDIWQCPETVLVVITGKSGGCSWHLVSRTSDASKIYNAQDSPHPTTKNCPAPNVSNAEVEKLWCKQREEKGIPGKR